MTSAVRTTQAALLRWQPGQLHLPLRAEEGDQPIRRHPTPDQIVVAACIFPPRDLIALKPQFAQLRRGFQNTRSARTPGLRLVEGLSLVERSKAACLAANPVNRFPAGHHAAKIRGQTSKALLLQARPWQNSHRCGAIAAASAFFALKT
ncbi:hypothetical protein BDD41_3708 [Paracoccus versutus]|uniref:Uncharacterized protein n=1 Tax=Paracoccus versutus TaxID=34007 RepID=A0A3D9XG86_PARVE|nr:hypothetical protein BDD41_3708 [Paracoccus versutus]